MADSAGGRPGWRLLGAFWAVMILAAGAGVGALQSLGPPAAAPPAASRAKPDQAASHAAAPETPASQDATGAHEPAVVAHPTTAPGPVQTPTVPAASPDRIVPPVAALMEASQSFPLAQLPRIAPDGRMSRLIYAAPAPAVPPGSSRVALLFSGFGLSDRESRAAIENLPGPVSFAVSSYATDIGSLLITARSAGHELLASIPMEPQGYPANDEGTRSLRTGLSQQENATNLEWALSRTQGIVGATGASDGMRGERFADIPASFDPVVAEVTRRGLLYIDARPGRTQLAGVPARAIDVVLDDQLGRAEIDARLQSLERTAQEHGSAIGLVGTLRPATIERIAAWTKTLQGRGLVLVPVSAVVNP